MKSVKFTILILITFWAINGSVFGQNAADLAKYPELESQDIRPVVNEINALSAADLQKMLANVKPDTSVEEARKGLPENLRKSVVEQTSDFRLQTAAMRAVKLTKAQYEFILINSPSPVAISDSNCLLLVTTGMIDIARNQDGLVGVILHELAHGLYGEQTLQARLRFNKGVREKNVEAMVQARKELALIEVKCDLVAAKLMSNAKMNVPSYVEILDLLEPLRNNAPVQWHPTSTARASAIKLLVAPNVAGITTK